MVVHVCERCKKEFKKKSHYLDHINKKFICKEFNDNNCTQLIEKYRQSELGHVVGKFSTLDKARIEAESIHERNQRIFFGALVLLGGVVIITMFSKKK